MSLDNLLEQYRKREILPDRPLLSGSVDRAENVFTISEKENIPYLEADAILLSQELMDYTRKLTDSPLYQKMDGLIDVFDPSEPPVGVEGVPDPMGELLQLELAAVREPVKWALKASSYLFAPIDRGWKFITNAMMYDPLTKSVSEIIKRRTLQSAIAQEKFRIAQEEALKIRKEKGLPTTQIELGLEKLTAVLSKERMAEIDREVDERAVSSIRAMQAEDTEGVEVADFLESGKDALKSLVPWPGFADDVKSFGEISAGSYERIVGQEAPFWYAPLGDIALQTTAMIGLMKMSQSATTAKDAAALAKGAKLTPAEVNAIKKLHKAASQVAKTPVKAISVPSKEETLTAPQKLIQLIKEARPLRSRKSLLVHKDRQEKARKLAQVQKNVRGARLVGTTKGALKGKSAVPDFTPLDAGLTPVEIDTLFDMVNTSALGVGFDKGRAVLSLDKLLKGNLLTKSEIAGLEQVFGTGLTKALWRKSSISSIIQDLTFEIFNIPRALLASGDLSAGGRQGIIFSVSHPIASTKAMGRSIRAALSKSYADDIERVTKKNKWGQLADAFGVHSSPTGFAAKLAEKEEVYMSRIAESIPFGIGRIVAASERAFATFLNQQRREVFTAQAKKWIRRGITPYGKKRTIKEFGEIVVKGKRLTRDQKTYQQYAAFVNHATGRGSLEQMKPGALTALNAAFFSPRLQVSRVQVIGDLISPKTTWTARKVIARDLAEFYATGMGIMGMAKAGGAEVEMDSRSSDFGKIKVGNTRYNYWGPFQPMARLSGQMFSGEIKLTGTGKIKDKAQTELLISFLRTKLAPVPGRLVDVAVGETFLGEPVEPTPKFALKTAYESLTPLFLQDVIDAWRFQGVDAQFPLSAGLAFTGIGVQTWELAPFAELELQKDSLSRQTFGKNYDELSYIESRELDMDILINHPGIVDLERQVKFESGSVNFLKRQAQEQRKSERRLEKRLNKNLREELAENFISIGGIDRTFGNWRLNDEQYKEYEQRVARNINELFEEMKPLWDTKTKENKYELMSQILRSAKLLAAQEMKIGDME